MYSVSKTSKACARPGGIYDYIGAKPIVQNFELIELTKNHQFENEDLWSNVGFGVHEKCLVMKLLFPKEYRVIACGTSEELEIFFRRSVAVFNRDGWILCVPKDEVFEK